jgi:hypothetical protein
MSKISDVSERGITFLFIVPAITRMKPTNVHKQKSGPRGPIVVKVLHTKTGTLEGTEKLAQLSFLRKKFFYSLFFRRVNANRDPVF